MEGIVVSENETLVILDEEEVRLIRAYRKMTSERQKEFTDDLKHLLRMQEHAHDSQNCNA